MILEYPRQARVPAAAESFARDLLDTRKLLADSITPYPVQRTAEPIAACTNRARIARSATRSLLRQTAKPRSHMKRNSVPGTECVREVLADSTARYIVQPAIACTKRAPFLLRECVCKVLNNRARIARSVNWSFVRQTTNFRPCLTRNFVPLPKRVCEIFAGPVARRFPHQTAKPTATHTKRIPVLLPKCVRPAMRISLNNRACNARSAPRYFLRQMVKPAVLPHNEIPAGIKVHSLGVIQ